MGKNKPNKNQMNKQINTKKNIENTTTPIPDINEQSQHRTTIVQEIRFASMDDYDKVRKENDDLRKKLSDMLNNEFKLKNYIETNLKTIETLTNENMFLRRKIDELELKNAKLELKNAELELKNVNLTTQVDKLTTWMDETKKR
jgi:hypothetical protein